MKAQRAFSILLPNVACGLLWLLLAAGCTSGLAIERLEDALDGPLLDHPDDTLLELDIDRAARLLNPLSRGYPLRGPRAYNGLTYTRKGNIDFGLFYYRERGKHSDRVEVDPLWIAANLVEVRAPLAHGERTILVHVRAKANFIKAFNRIRRDARLRSLVKSIHGAFDQRYKRILASNRRELSNHSWGIAIDINASAHPQGAWLDDESDPNTILWTQAFQPAGFNWGNDFSDPMHFEIRSVLEDEPRS